MATLADLQKEQLMLYAALKKEAKRIDEEIAQLQPTVLDILLSNKTDDMEDIKIETELGSFTLAKRLTWHYQDDVLEVEELVKKVKKDAQRTGKADFDETYSVYFREKKVVD